MKINLFGKHYNTVQKNVATHSKSSEFSQSLKSQLSSSHQKMNGPCQAGANLKNIKLTTTKTSHQKKGGKVKFFLPLFSKFKTSKQGKTSFGELQTTAKKEKSNQNSAQTKKTHSGHQPTLEGFSDQFLKTPKKNPVALTTPQKKYHAPQKSLPKIQMQGLMPQVLQNKNSSTPQQPTEATKIHLKSSFKNDLKSHTLFTPSPKKINSQTNPIPGCNQGASPLKPPSQKFQSTLKSKLAETKGLVESKRIVIVGHGGLRAGNEPFKIPEGVEIIFYGQHEKPIFDDLGHQIETGAPTASPVETLSSGDTSFDYALTPLDDARITPPERFKGVCLRAPPGKEIRLSQILELGYKGKIHWAACRSVVGQQHRRQ